MNIIHPYIMFTSLSLQGREDPLTTHWIGSLLITRQHRDQQDKQSCMTTLTPNDTN